MVGEAKRIFGVWGHLAVWAALYQVGALVVVSAAMGREASGWAMCGVGGIALSTYLKDRVKLRRAHWDPADEVAHPARAAFLRGRVGMVRVVMVVALLGGMACMATVHPALAAVGPAAWAGVIWYGRPRAGGAKRPKDVLVVKNLIVAGSIAGMIGVVVWTEGANIGVRMALGLGLLVVQVFGDAVVCDNDDRAGDAQFGTRTIAVARGARCAWIVAFISQGIASGALIALGLVGELNEIPSLIWGIGGAVGTAMTVLMARGARRDATDAKLAALGAMVLLSRLL